MPRIELRFAERLLNIIESRNAPTFRQYTFLLFLRRLAGFSNSAGAFGCRR
jgi:hypothetical protein